MPKRAKELTAIQVRRLTRPGQHAVGTVAGLRLSVKPSGARSWILRTMVRGRRTDIGLGSYPTVTLAMAQERARDKLDAIHAGADPVRDKRQRRKHAAWTFKRVAEAYIAAHRTSWKNVKHAKQWENTLAAYAYPHFGDKHVADVTKQDVLAAIEPIWTKKNETARRVRNRIELVLSYAMQREYRPEGLNPARLKGNLDVVLARRARTIRRHHAALQIDQMHEFMQRLRKMEGTGARALEFTILTAARSGEVRHATWPEIDLGAAIWLIPGERMKSGRVHRVPLSDRAVQLLAELPRFEGIDLVFPGSESRPLSDMTLTAVLRRMRVPSTVHGFRSVFADWCAERTATPAEVREMALAHSIGDQTVAAYQRSDLFEKRRTLMQEWVNFLDTRYSRGNVRPLRHARQM